MDAQALSPYLLAAGLAWLTAQFLKYVFASIKARNIRQFKQFYLSGDMPSAHSATVVALATTIGFFDGANSAIFALALVFAAVVMYDAVMVRRSSGEQGAALIAFFTEVKSKIAPPRVAKGHTPLEVVAGAIVGVLIAIVVYFATIS